MKLHQLKTNEGSKHRVKRLGKGESSGLGKTSGKGHKGQKARSGGGVRIGFEGGQMPLHRRLPKRGFNNTAFAKVYAVLNVSDLEERFEAGETVDEAILAERKLVQGRYYGVKILGNGEITKALKVNVSKLSTSAIAKIEAAGGTIVAPAAESNPAKEEA